MTEPSKEASEIAARIRCTMGGWFFLSETEAAEEIAAALAQRDERIRRLEAERDDAMVILREIREWSYMTSFGVYALSPSLWNKIGAALDAANGERGDGA